MINIIPRPSKQNSLLRLISNIPITSVVDVGVREQTAQLITSFPHLTHHLFEPCAEFFEDIKRNYAHIDHVLYPLALSDEDSEIYLVTSSLEKNGIATHSQISDIRLEVDGLHLLTCEPINVKRFDGLAIASSINDNFLLKIDVDGKDLNVIKGFGKELKKASSIVIECTTNNMIERISYIQSQGYALVDIVDLVYYGDSLYQFDAVLIRSNLLHEKIKPTFDPFKSELWHQI